MILRAPLWPHPETPCDALAYAEIEAERDGAALRLCWRLRGATRALVWPNPGTGRTDFLWRRTCFEAFIQAPPDNGYIELNHGDGAWAAYRFSGYRSGMGDAALDPPDLQVDRALGLVEARWTLDLPVNAPWRLGATMVIEADGGRLSYWSVNHPRARPEFHDAAGWTLELPPQIAV